VHSRRALPAQRSAIACARDERTGVLMTRAPSAAEHLDEDAGELGIPIADEEFDGLGALTQVYEQISCLLGDPGLRLDWSLCP
jgi:hypothetical protein